MDKEIQEFLHYLKKNNNKQKAYFGIFQYGGGPDESFIKANKEGVLQFLQDLTQAYITIEENLERGEAEQKNIHYLSYEEDWVDNNSRIFLQYLELTQQERTEVIKESEQPTLTDKVMPIGCIGLLIVVVSCTFIGFGTVVGWIFK